MTRAPTADGQKTRLLQPSPPSPPPGLCVPMLGGSRLYRGGGYWPPWGNGGNCQIFISRLEAEPTSRPASRLRAASRGSRCGGEDSSLQDLSVILSGDAVSHGYGLATVSGERAWLCPQFPPLPEWLRPPPARGHPVSSRGRIERHGAHKATKDRGRSRGLRREPVRGAACQSEMYQFIWCSGTHRAAWRSTMPETVALVILRFGSRCNRAIWINSGCWNGHTLVG